jgi:hypothetical protein
MMPQPASSPGEPAARGYDVAHRAAFGLARDRGAQFITRELYQGSDITVRDMAPLDGAAAILARGGTPYLVSKRLHVSGTTAHALAARCQAVAP